MAMLHRGLVDHAILFRLTYFRSSWLLAFCTAAS